MRWLKFLLSLASLAVVTGAFFGMPFAYFATWFQAGPAFTSLFSSAPQAWIPFVVILALTLLFGRLFCEALCPLGALQTIVNALFHPKAHVRRVCTRLPETRAQRIVRWSVFALVLALSGAGFGALAGFLEPYALYGKALTLCVSGIVVCALVLILSVFGRGRFWCNWICPVGTFLAFAARLAPFGNRVGRRCENCRACFPKGDDAAKAEPTAASAEGVDRRTALKGVAAAAVAEKLTDGGFADVSAPGRPERVRPVLPPGAGLSSAFARRCTACGLCLTACPEKIIRPSSDWKRFGQPELDFRTGYCLATCVRCGTVCPTDALAPLQAEVKRDVHIGLAVWQKDLCLRTTGAEKNCEACVRKCPHGAIRLIAGYPVVDAAACVGCGACEHVCPARPLPAMQVRGYDMQKTVRPMDEGELVAEMRARLAEGASAVTAAQGVITAVETGRGIGPLVRLHDAGRLREAILVDKVIGRAAAALCVSGGAKKVFAALMGEDAKRYLEAHGLAAAAEKVVPQIRNRTQTDACPMEKAVARLEDPAEMVSAIRKTLEGMKTK